ncbi:MULTISPECIES: molybdopterin-dependent oxidoreductase [Halorussus]|uniref:molybdopterin-dependent oxidoreductase n=1 Tax=Halorussus TaxID=1070314 RepID=UPI000E210566|nr:MULTISPECIES: molybdopterin-dependent oxidoreductase [Halorussus]NHN58728.1 molybdopterin-dependent oxidoreductase [Halorussus sp. JP-T4]
MSKDESDTPGPTEHSPTEATPGVPNVDDPRSSTPLTEDFRTGTANDPDVGTDDGGMTSLTVDGDRVAVAPGSTLIDAVEAVDAESDVPALCYYDRDTEQGDEIGPRGTCRTCMVETAEHGVVPACSFPAEDGLDVRTDATDAAEARDVNLDLVLANHNLRCTTCGQNGRCELQDTAIDHGVNRPRYGVFDERDAYAPIDDTSVIQIDRNKCILCNRCVEACNDVQNAGVLRMSGQGDDIHVDFQKHEAETMAESTCISCGHCVTVCPTGSLVEDGLTDATTIPLPGFTQKNSIGEVQERPAVETADTAEAPNRDVPETARAGGATGPDSATDDRSTPATDTRAHQADDRSGVAGFMAKAKQQATEASERAKRRATDASKAAADDALESVEHAAESVAEETLTVGQLFDAAEVVSRGRKRSLTVADTTCTYCGVGCRFELYGRGEEVLGARPADPDQAPANDFSTCVKGKFGYDFVDSDDRLRTPLVKEDGEFREASWEEALDRVAGRLSEIRDEHGAESLAVTSSSKATNEENFLAQKFARQVLGTPHVDNCTRLCHSSTVAALKETVGYGAMTNRINEDIGETDCYLITGSNTTESHPVLATRIVQNVRDGADLFVFDPRETTVAEHADQYSRTQPGADIAWLNGMMRHIVAEDLYDEAFVDERTRHFDELVEAVEPYTPEVVEELTDVPPVELKHAAETIATADTCVYGWAMGLTQHTHGTRNALAIANLALLCGHVGEPRSGLSPFRGQNNVQGGGGDMGPIPNNLPGYQSVEDDEVLDKFEAEWGVRPPDEVGLRVTDMFSAIPGVEETVTGGDGDDAYGGDDANHGAGDEAGSTGAGAVGDEGEPTDAGASGERETEASDEQRRGTDDPSAEEGYTPENTDLRGMYIVGENPAVSEPDLDHVEEALAALDFLVVQELFMTETAKHADVVLPAASLAEKYGTITNTERRVQLVRPAVESPGEARTDAAILQDLAGRMGFDWDYGSAADVMDEINDLAPIYGGVTHERLEEKEDGLQWPCWDEDHPGTPYLYEDEFNFDDGRARFVPSELPEERLPAPTEEYPFTLSTGRVLYHWHTGSMTRRVETSMQHVPESFVTVHPDAADRLGIDDGEYVAVESAQGEIVVRANVEETSGPDVLFIPMHFVNGAVNRLTEEQFDPTSRIPRYKVTNVRVRPLGPDPEEEPTSPDELTGDDSTIAGD